MKKIKVVDTNIGDFICSVFTERPYSFKSSAAHKNTDQIADIYTNQFGVKENLNAKQLTIYTKNILRKEVYNPEALITGANFLISNTGSIVFTENEGNILKSTSFAPIHIIVAGIDKMITSIDELSLQPQIHPTQKAVCKGTIFFSRAQQYMPILCCITYKKSFFHKNLRNRLQKS